MLLTLFGCASAAPTGGAQPEAPLGAPGNTRGQEGPSLETGSEEIDAWMRAIDGELGKYSEDFGVESGTNAEAAEGSTCGALCDSSAKVCALADRICLATAGDDPCAAATKGCQSATLRCERCK